MNAEDMYVKMLVEQSERIKPGADFSMYLLTCGGCKQYRRLLASAPVGPGGTLSCPICRALKQNGPHIEGAFGHVRSRRFTMKLPAEVGDEFA